MSAETTPERLCSALLAAPHPKGGHIVDGACEDCGRKPAPELPNGCTVQRASDLLSVYDMRRRHGYQNQIIAARRQLTHATGMGVRELRGWLREWRAARDARVLTGIRELEASRLARGVCRHCGGPVPCWSPFGDVEPGVGRGTTL